QQAVPALRGATPEAVQGLPGRREGRRQRREVQVRVRQDRAEQGLQQEVRKQRFACLRSPEAVQLDELRPGDRGQVDRGRPPEPGQGREEVGRRQLRQGQQVAGEVAA